MTARTLPELFRQQADRLGPRVAVRSKQYGLYADLRWAEYADQVSACAAALVRHGIQPGDRVGILAENRLEWLVADMAILSIGAVNVPLHAPLSAKQIQFQLDDAGVRFLFVSNAAQYAKVQQIRGELPNLRERSPSPPAPLPRGGEGGKIVMFDEPALAGTESWAGFLQRGRAERGALSEIPLTADDLATIIYTSGTTGNPKGVMLTHGNLFSNALEFTQVSPFSPDSIFLNWLPFSHIYARTIDIYVTLAVGATLSLAESADTVVANIGEVQPTNLSAVPRFYEKVLAAVKNADAAVTAKRLRGIFGRGSIG